MQPIADAEELIAAAVRAALAPIAGTYAGKPKVYYQVSAEGAPLPIVLFHFQTPITPLRRWIGQPPAVTALLLVKAMAASAKAARELLEQTTAPMHGLATVGYTITAQYTGSPPIPPLGDLYQSAHTWRINLERNP